MLLESVTQQISVVGSYSSYFNVDLIFRQERKGPYQDSEL